MNEVKIEIKFDMPYSLEVVGDFVVRDAGEEFYVNLTTHYEDKPRLPGGELIENLSIVQDDTIILSHTKVVARYLPKDPTVILEPRQYSKDVVYVALSLANRLVTGVRLAHKDYIKNYLYLPKHIGPITFSVPSLGGRKKFSGLYDPLMGGITTRSVPRSNLSASDFANVVANGKSLPIAQELYFDARRYLLSGNRRMALANLVMSFEVGLADALIRIAVLRNDSALERGISEATTDDELIGFM